MNGFLSIWGWRCVVKGDNEMNTGFVKSTVLFRLLQLWLNFNLFSRLVERLIHRKVLRQELQFIHYEFWPLNPLNEYPFLCRHNNNKNVCRNGMDASLESSPTHSIIIINFLLCLNGNLWTCIHAWMNENFKTIVIATIMNAVSMNLG